MMSAASPMRSLVIAAGYVRPLLASTTSRRYCRQRTSTNARFDANEWQDNADVCRRLVQGEGRWFARQMAPKKKTRAMSDEHKAALAEGRAQGRAVRLYLEALEANKPKRGRKR